MVDGHEDAYPPSTSPTGEASDSELGIALGMFDDALPPELERLTPLLAPENVALIGPRDRAELIANAVPSLRDRVWLRTDAEVRDARGGRRRAGGRGRGRQRRLVLAPRRPRRPRDRGVPRGRLPPAPRPDLDRARGDGRDASRAPACAGLSIVIYNPDLDPDRRDGERIVRFAETVLSALHLG